MKVNLEGKTDSFEEIKKVIIQIGDVDFRITENNLGDLVINKFQLGDGESAIVIIPKVSNEIRVR
jgi:hypothetical protein